MKAALSQPLEIPSEMWISVDPQFWAATGTITEWGWVIAILWRLEISLLLIVLPAARTAEWDSEKVCLLGQVLKPEIETNITLQTQEKGMYF